MKRIALCLAALVPPLVLPGLGTLLSLAWVVAVLVLVKDSRRPTLDPWWRGPLASVALGIAGGLAVAALAQFVYGPVSEALGGAAADTSDFDAIRGNPGKLAMLLALGIGFGGVVEETIFRGFVVGWGSALMGQRWAWPLALLSAAIFGFTHLYQGWGGVIETGLIGLTLGAVYILAGRKLVPAIVAHATVNTIGILTIYWGG